jgi:hypothetical protein
MNKRLGLALITGIILGIFCVVGAAFRLGWDGNQLLLFSLWYNRVIMGLLLGLAGSMVIVQGKLNWLLRGAGLGLVVSAAYFFTAGAQDWVSFLAGAVYGVIIEFILHKYADPVKNI